MNRIEAINAMLDGKVVRNNCFHLLRIANKQLECFDTQDNLWRTLPLVSYALDERFGYTLPNKTTPNYAMIDGKKYKLVRERIEDSQEE